MCGEEFWPSVNDTFMLKGLRRLGALWHGYQGGVHLHGWMVFGILRVGRSYVTLCVSVSTDIEKAFVGDDSSLLPAPLLGG